MAVVFCGNAVWVACIAYHLWSRSKDLVVDSAVYANTRRGRRGKGGGKGGGDATAVNISGSHFHGNLVTGDTWKQTRDSNFAGDGGDDAGGAGGDVEYSSDS
jgi:hypothetical protein